MICWGRSWLRCRKKTKKTNLKIAGVEGTRESRNISLHMLCVTSISSPSRGTLLCQPSDPTIRMTLTPGWPYLKGDGNQDFKKSLWSFAHEYVEITWTKHKSENTWKIRLFCNQKILRSTQLFEKFPRCAKVCGLFFLGCDCRVLIGWADKLVLVIIRRQSNTWKAC